MALRLIRDEARSQGADDIVEDLKLDGPVGSFDVSSHFGSMTCDDPILEAMTFGAAYARGVGLGEAAGRGRFLRLRRPC